MRQLSSCILCSLIIHSCHVIIESMCHGWELITSSFLKALKHLEIDDEKDDDDDVDGVCDDDIKFAKNKPIK